jgi:hypothetical protein
MLNGIIGLMVAFFLIAEPFFIFNAYGKKGIKHKAKVLHKEESMIQKAEEHLRDFSKKEIGMTGAKEEEKHDIVKAQGFVDRLKYFIEAEQKLLVDLDVFVRKQNEPLSSFPEKSELIRLLNEENVLADEIIKELVEARKVGLRVILSEKKEVGQLQKDLHKALVMEKEAKFEHSISKTEIDAFRKEYSEIAQREKELKTEEHNEKEVVNLIANITVYLQELKRFNSSSIHDLSNSGNILANIKKHESLTSKKKGELSKIIVNLHVLGEYIKKV